MALYAIDMIIDSHTHIGEFGGKHWAPEQLIQSMDEAGIDISLLIANFFGKKGSEGVSTKEVIEVCKKFPRLKAIGNVDYSQVSEQQIEQLQDAIEKKLIVGVKFFLGYELFYPNDVKLHPLYEFCSLRNVPVVFHTGMLESGFSGLLKYSHPLGVDEVAAQFPDLKIVMAHFGNPWIADCAAVVAKNKNVYVDLSGYFSEYKPIAEEEKQDFVKQLSEFKMFAGDFTKCLFGTDWPIYSQKEYLEAIRALPMTDEEKKLIFSKNAQKLFNIQP
ncbi:MAG: amidohydrolase family protein [Patescibacteria group bacterium]